MKCPHCGGEFAVTPEYALPVDCFIRDGKLESGPKRFTNDPVEYINAIRAFHVQQQEAFDAMDT